MERSITALTPQKRNKERVNVFLDGDFAFGVEMPIALKLKVGQQLTSDEVARLREDDQRALAYNRAVRYLSYRPRSRWEVAHHLRKKEHHDDHVEEALARLENLGYVDDAEFARFWCDNRARFKPRSARALRYELRQKGVENGVIDEALAGLDEEEAARAALEAKLSSWQRLDEATFRKRAMGFLSRRGFSYAIVRLVCDEAWSQLHDE